MSVRRGLASAPGGFAPPEAAKRHDCRMSGWYESWFISARDPGSPRALWIRHTRLRRGGEPDLVALWCTVLDRHVSPRPVVVKEVFDAFAPGTDAGPTRFRGQAVVGERTAGWDLAVSASQPPYRPLRPAILYRAPLPRTKLEASVPDGLISGVLELDGDQIAVDQWRATVGHNWGAAHADSWVWLHAGGLSTAPHGWLDLVIARIRLGPALSPWTAIGGLSLGGAPILLGGLGRRTTVDANPGRLTASVPSRQAVLTLNVTANDDDAVALAYADPSGGTRTVRHAAVAALDLTVHRRGESNLDMSATCAYEFGTGERLPGIVAQPLPEG
jgi:hypothetical protein